MEDKFLPTC